MRYALWTWLRSGVPQGEVLPAWLLVARAILFPLDFFYWRMSRSRGYQVETDTWLIEGVRYSGEVLRMFAAARGGSYRVIRFRDIVVVERSSSE